MSEASSLNLPPICVIIARTRHKMILAEIQEATKRGAEFLEIRLDYLRKQPDFHRLLEDKKAQMMATVRRPSDGGRWAGNEEMRQTLLRQAIVAGFDWVDLEADIIDKIPRFGSVRRVVSYHNVRETPENLEDIYQNMCKQDADVVKVAVRAQQPSDTIRTLKLLRNAPKPTVAIAMGDLGIPSRILGAKFGSPFTYAAFNQERALAPGLMSFREFQKIYDYSRINSETKVYGVIGDPIGHSLSPLIHNRAFREMGINSVYLPFRVPREELQEFCEQYESIPVDGYSVTIPHKEEAALLGEEKDPAVLDCKAANTLIHQENGTFSAHNTDYVAAVETLKERLAKTSSEGEASLASRTVLILGAGGVARAIAFALKREKAIIRISGRTFEKASALAEQLQARAVDWVARHSANCDILINCTPVGMHPNVDESPVHPSYLHPKLMVFDTVYIPETTLLVKQARERGAEVVTGVEFFLRQAALQFKLFTGQNAPLEVMERVVRRSLSPVRTRQGEDE